VGILRGEIVKSEQEIRDEIKSLGELALSMFESLDGDDSPIRASLKARYVDMVYQDMAQLRWVLGE